MESIEVIRAIKKRDDAFTKWRRRTIIGLPQLAERVFALRHRPDSPNWSLEKSLGFVIGHLTNADDGSYYVGYDAIGFQMVLKIQVAALYEDVAKAEKRRKKS